MLPGVFPVEPVVGVLCDGGIRDCVESAVHCGAAVQPAGADAYLRAAKETMAVAKILRELQSYGVAKQRQQAGYVT